MSLALREGPVRPAGVGRGHETHVMMGQPGDPGQTWLPVVVTVCWLLVTENNLSYLKQKGDSIRRIQRYLRELWNYKQPGLRKGRVKESPGTAAAVDGGPSP